MSLTEQQEQMLLRLAGRVEDLENKLSTTRASLGLGIGDSPTFSGLTLNTVKLPSTTTSVTGVIFKGSNRFIHDFHHPAGNSAVPSGANVFVGENAGNFTTGSTATSTNHGSFNVGVGYSALVALTIGYMNVGIGRLALGQVGTGYQNMALGYTALYNITSGYQNVAIGHVAGRYINAGGANVTSNTSVYIGSDTRASANGNVNEVVIGNAARGQGSNTIMLGNSAITSLCCYDTSISSPSDKRIKKNVVSLKPAAMLGFINDLNPVTYKKINPKDWDEKFKSKKPKKVKGEPELEEYITEDNPNIYAGLIAQDVEKAMKKHGVDYELVPHLHNDMLAIRYIDLIPALIGAVKELARKVELLS